MAVAREVRVLAEEWGPDGVAAVDMAKNERGRGWVVMTLGTVTSALARNREERWIWGFTAVCLSVFLASIALPRADNLLLGSDAPHYYAYLPSLLFDQDVDLSNQYAHLLHRTGAITAPTVDAVPPTPPEVWWDAHGLLFWRGYLPQNRNPVGTAVLWMPFFLIAHVVASALALVGLPVSTDGYSYLYQGMVLSGSVIYGGLGLLLTYRFAGALVGARPAVAATLVVAAAGNLVYYMTADPGMPHTASIFASGLLFYTWVSRADRPTVASAAMLGLAGGLMALVRPQDGLMLAVPFLAALPSVVRSLRRRLRDGAALRFVRNALVAAAVSGAVFSPQALIWGGLRVGIDYTPLSTLEVPPPPPTTAESPEVRAEGQRFRFARPDVGNALFGAPLGLVSWHPVFLLALVGLVPAVGRVPRYAVGALVGFLIQLYIVGIFYGQGESFGARVFIVCTPVFALGLASLASSLRPRLSVQPMAWAASALVLWNAIIYVAYRFEYVATEGMLTLGDITVGRVAAFLRVLGWG